MKEMNKSSRTIGYLEKLFRGLNERFYNGELPNPVIHIMPDMRSYGHIEIAKNWHCENGVHAYELNISGYHLDRPIENVAATLCHEMAHLYALENGIQDTSRGNTYHNKRFKEIAEKHGCVISYDKRIGYSLTEPNDQLIEWLLENDFIDISFYKEKPFFFGFSGGSTIDVDTDNNTVTVTPKSSTRKYQCPKCKASFRATSELDVLHIPCGVKFEVVK